MSEQLGRNITQARKAKGLTQGAIAKHLKVSRAAVSQWEAGSTEPTTANLLELCKFLDLDIARATGGEVKLVPDPENIPDDPYDFYRVEDKRPNKPEPERKERFTPEPHFFSRDRNMPVYSATEGGNGFLIVSTEAIEYVERPHTLEAVPDAYAILVTGDSMFPAYEPEDKAWVNPRLAPARNKNCVFYSIDEYGERRATIKRLVSWTDAYWLVEQFNPPKKFKLVRPQWNVCHRVVGKFNA